MLKSILQKSIIINFLFLLDIYASPIINNKCNWTGRSTSKKKIVTSVYLECSSGRIEWTNPYHGGALVIVLKVPFPERQFDACFKISSDTNSRFSFLYNKSLIPLYSPGKNNPKSIRCYSAQNTNQLMIYAESFKDQLNNSKNHTIIEYDLENKSSLINNNECKPCSDDEMSNLFCESDIVVRGKIKNIENWPDIEDTTILIQTNNYLRKTIETPNNCDINYDEYVNNEIMRPITDIQLNHLRPLRNTRRRNDYLKILVSKSCGIVYNDSGEYVFLLKWKLSTFRLLCAPRLKDWIQSSYRFNDTSCKLR